MPASIYEIMILPKPRPFCFVRQSLVVLHTWKHFPVQPCLLSASTSELRFLTRFFCFFC
jgi:hypothetical protein